MTNSSGLTARTELEQLARVSELREAGVSGIAELLGQLPGATWRVRRAVVAALAEANADGMVELRDALVHQRRDEATISGLVDALSTTANPVDQLVLELCADESPAVLCDAAQILGRRESAASVPTLQHLTAHADDNVALAAVEALGRIGGREALDGLLALAASRNFFRTFPTIDILGRSGDPRALQVLLDLASEPLYASEAVRALGRLGHSSAVPALVDQLSRASDSLVSAIAVSLVAIHGSLEKRFGTGAALERQLAASPKLGELRRKLSLALKRADPAEQVALGQTLAWVGEESTVPTLIDLLRGPPAVARVAIASLKKLGTIAEPRLLEALQNGTSEERRVLVPMLAGRLAARDQLVACLEDEDPTVVALSCDALARTSDATAAPAIFRLLGDPDARVGQAALAAIQSLGSDETCRLALVAAQATDSRRRSAALRIIGYFGYQEGMDSLIAGTLSSDEKVREAAFAGLPFIEHPRALSVLLDALSDPSARTRTAAVRALGHTAGEPQVRERLRDALGDADAWVRYYACQALGRLRDDAATERFASLLADDFGQVRVAAVEALAHLRGPRAFEVLSQVLGSEDADLNRAALLALGLSKRPEALPHLQLALDTGSAATRLVALSALAELGLADALPAIAQATRDTDEGVRVSALGFLTGAVQPQATTELLDLLVQTPDHEELMLALSRPVPGRAQAIGTALSSADDALASALVSALARMQSAEASAMLRGALSSSNDAARRAAASALVAMEDADSAALLERAALNDPDAEMRRICSAILIR